jgi:hypothetical protein
MKVAPRFLPWLPDASGWLEPAIVLAAYSYRGSFPQLSAQPFRRPRGSAMVRPARFEPAGVFDARPGMAGRAAGSEVVSGGPL